MPDSSGEILTAAQLTAVILAGGKGTRLRPITENIPKALVEVHGRPMIHHLIDYLRAGGLGRFVVCTGYKAEMLEDSLEAEFAGRGVSCIDSGDVPMTDRVVAACENDHGPILICYGDTLANVDIHALVDFHNSGGFDATVSVYPLQSPFGIVTSDQSGAVTEMAEKPKLPYWINIGFAICSERALAHLERGRDLVSFLDVVRRRGTLGAYRHTGRHVTVNTEKERTAVEAERLEFLTVMEDQTK